MARAKGKPLARMSFLSSRGAKERSMVQEDRIASEIGGKRQFASGALQGWKGDIDNAPLASLRSDRLKVEAKTTTHLSYKLNLCDLEKIEEEAILDGKKGCMIISFGDKEDYVVIRKEYLKF